MNQIFTVHPGISLANEVVSFVSERVDVNNPLALSDVTIFVPSPRLATSVRNAFIAASGQGTLLPRIRPFSFAEEEGEELHFQADELSLAPSGKRVVNSLSRLMLLARWVSAKDKQASFAQSLQGASTLAQLFSRLTAYNIDLAELNAAVPPEVAQHWQQNLSFLEIALRQYPSWLTEKDAIDSAQLSREVLLGHADLYHKQGFENLTIAAGFSDSTPAGIQALKAIISQTNGYLILPGLDRGMDDEIFENLNPTHPQYTMAKMLNKLSIKRADVQTLGEPKVSAGAHMWRMALMPPEGALPEELRSQIPPQALNGLSITHAENLQEEAEIIASMMRESLEEKGKTCALVSPDRGLASRVASALKRWDIDVDDSAGTPLSSTSLGIFFKQSVQNVLEEFRPSHVANLIKHPLCRCGENTSVWKKWSGSLEELVLRGTKPSLGQQGLQDKLKATGLDASSTRYEQSSLILSALEKAYEGDFDLHGKHFLPQWISWHIDLCTRLATVGDDTESWLEGDAADALLGLLESWQQAMAETGSLTLKDYFESLENLMEQSVVRARHSLHPRLFIWGPLEARLQTVDRIIIGGANEGLWPRASKPDPWLNRAMAEKVGLPDQDVSIGMGAHDFVTLASGKEVFITRALKDGEGEAVTSRFLARLEALLAEDDWQSLLVKGQVWQKRVESLRRQGQCAGIEPASIVPSLQERPSLWSASTVRDLMQCPYKSYINKILKVHAVDEYEQMPTAADRGSLIHLALEAFFKQTDDLPEPYTGLYEKQPMLDHLLHIGRHVFAAIEGQSVRAVWWQKFELIAKAFVDEMIVLNQKGRHVSAVEKKAEMALVDGIKLHARADRVDEIAGQTVVVDYKTGLPPSAGKVQTGEEPQMAVEAVLTKNGAYGTPKDVGGLEYWRLSDGVKVSQAAGVKKDLEEFTSEAEAGLKDLAIHFQQTETEYEALPASATGLSKEGVCRMCDYAGICRFQDWAPSLGAKS